ncbi:MAG: bifunctional adenosylcobinamide kinase/adenosylcobinamide-phosphate guanylyltransferase [Rhodocyclaceae bacterium]|jgi:adenosylcobinamide kinase/adenosylcobinamide-phosphate guanylyltransferase|nr:bifunctional adenosylcobinamide kinase/adenosylcobinamide-phosphate guanylyltransferase [Rhodocyclaceae bacterium]MCL4759820.1 bifunctional adenosylcobinamide kinase/adenosylcobinamide-phosphate guanylyltransferase [Rhodocyclaceae bacterium]
MPAHLILGGARSGKSRHAEHCAQSHGGPVTVIATATALDAEMAARIARHRADRPADWHTLEVPHALAAALKAVAAPDRCILVDCLTLWLTNLLASTPELPDPPDAQALQDFQRERAALLDVLPILPGRILLVANETGFGLVPQTPLGRLFRDEAGRLNQDLAARCDEVSLVVAGLPLRLKGSPAA